MYQEVKMRCIIEVLLARDLMAARNAAVILSITSGQYRLETLENTSNNQCTLLIRDEAITHSI
jgi:hypothetical protein